MARLVVISFDDNEAAERFVDHMNNKMGAGALNQASIAIAYGHVEMLLAQPTMFCQCKNPDPKHFGRTKKFGWYVHRKCNKPTERNGRSLRSILSTAYNLLPGVEEKKNKYGALLP